MLHSLLILFYMMRERRKKAHWERDHGEEKGLRKREGGGRGGRGLVACRYNCIISWAFSLIKVRSFEKKVRCRIDLMRREGLGFYVLIYPFWAFGLVRIILNKLGINPEWRKLIDLIFSNLWIELNLSVKPDPTNLVGSRFSLIYPNQIYT